MLKIWISGAKGQIGRALNKAMDRMEYEILNTDVEYLDITNMEEVLRFGELNRPDVIINCSGMMDIKLCEENPELAYKVNALGAKNLSVVSQRLQAKLVQFSTDDVFDGKCTQPYTEYDQTNPESVYGKSKLAGENYVKEFTYKHFIIRSTWVYGEGDNFVSYLLKKVNANEPIHISKEHFGSPTSADDLADFILSLVETNDYGTFHATSKGTCSRYEFAQEILRITGNDVKISAVSKTESDFSSHRPEYVVLDNFVLKMLKIYEFPQWQDALTSFLIKGGQ